MRLDSNMDTLIALGAGVAWAYSTFLLIAQPTHGMQALYFETGAMIVTLILLGRYLEARARGKAGQAIQALMQLQPDTALVQQDGRYVEVPIG
jgi:Cu+-exporting ATPase